MKAGHKGPFPWDIAVFLIITVFGLGYSIQNFTERLPADKAVATSDVQPFEEAALAETQPEISLWLGADGQTEALRRPAAMDNGQPQASRWPGAQTLDLGCLEKSAPMSEKIVRDGGPLRLKGKLCNLSHREMRHFDGVRIRNLTTGREATVYFHGFDSAFVTDFIDMRSGKNSLSIEWSESRKPHALLAEIFEK